MTKGITLDIAADTRQFQKSTKDAGDSLGDVSDALVDVARDGDKSTEKLEQSFKDLARSSQQQSNKIGQNFEKAIVHGTGGARKAVGAFKEEALQNFSEVSSSFDGSMQSLADGVQGTLGGLAAGIAGPAGLAIGAVGLLGGAALSAVGQNAAKQTQAVNDAFEDMVASGNKFVSEQFLQKGIQDVLEGNGPQSFDKIKDWAEQLKEPVSLLVAAFAGDKASIAEVTKAVQDNSDKIRAANKGVDRYTAIGVDRQIDNNNLFIDSLQNVGKNVDTAVGKAFVYTAANDRISKSLKEIGKAASDIPGNKTVKVTADTTALGKAVDKELAKPRKITVIPRYGRGIT